MVTSIEALKKIGSVEYELPPFADGTPFTARLKKVSIAEIAQTGAIPNPLLKKISKLISGGADDKNDSIGLEKGLSDDENTLKTFEFMLAVTKKSLISPTFAEIEKCGVGLTDEQISAIFTIALGFDSSLSSFRGVPGDT